MPLSFKTIVQSRQQSSLYYLYIFFGFNPFFVVPSFFIFVFVSLYYPTPFTLTPTQEPPSQPGVAQQQKTAVKYELLHSSQQVHPRQASLTPSLLKSRSNFMTILVMRDCFLLLGQCSVWSRGIQRILILVLVGLIFGGGEYCFCAGVWYIVREG